MSEDEQGPKKPGSNLHMYREEAGARAIEQLNAHRAAKKLQKEGSEWTIAQEILQEIMAGHTVVNPDKLPALTIMVDELKKEIELRYSDDEETKQIILNSIPTMRSVREWVKKDNWDTAVWGYVRAEGLFTSSKRAQVIESLRTRALDKSDVAAKIWLTLSGDYSEKMEVDNKSADIFREINSVIHGKKKQD